MKQKPIMGDVHEFDDGRFVFLGRHPDHEATWFLCFQAKDGDRTRIKLSNEAMEALVGMFTTYPPEKETSIPPLIDATDQTRVWKMVVSVT